MNTISVLVQYRESGNDRIDYVGGAFCYVANAGIDIEVPENATPLQALIYDLHQPEEIITITFRQARRRRMSPKDATSPPERQVNGPPVRRAIEQG